MTELGFIRRGTKIRGPRIPSPPFTVADRIPSSRRGTLRIGGFDSQQTYHEIVLTDEDVHSVEIIDPLLPPEHGIILDMIRTGAIQPGLMLVKTHIADHKLDYLCTVRIQGDGKVRYINGAVHETLKAATQTAIQDFEHRSGKKVQMPNVDVWDFWQYRDVDGTLRYLHVLRQRFEESQRQPSKPEPTTDPPLVLRGGGEQQEPE